MSGPIVRTAPTPKYSENWERAFGQKKTATPTPAKTKAKAKPAKKKKAAKGKK